MNTVTEGFWADHAAEFFENTELYSIVARSLMVSGMATLVAVTLGMPLGYLVGTKLLPGRRILLTLIHAGMGLPTVFVGLLGMLMLGREGPLGGLHLLYTPAAMVIAQAVLVVPIIAALAQQVLSELYGEYEEQLRSLGVSSARAIPTLLWDGRFSLLIAVLAGFGRASAEVGAVIIVGGNINHLTRVMTTTIALETSKGNLAMALGLGLILVLIVIFVNALTVVVRSGASRLQGR